MGRFKFTPLEPLVGPCPIPRRGSEDEGGESGPPPKRYCLDSPRGPASGTSAGKKGRGSGEGRVAAAASVVVREFMLLALLLLLLNGMVLVLVLFLLEGTA